MRHLFAFAVLVSSPAIARADGFQRGETVFKDACSGCHTVGFGSAAPAEFRSAPKVPGRSQQPTPERKFDLTGVTSGRDQSALRRFLAEPAKERPSSRCEHPPLLRDQVQALVRFLEVHAGPPPGEQVVPPRSKLRKRGDAPIRPAAAATQGASTATPGAPTGGAR